MYVESSVDVGRHLRTTKEIMSPEAGTTQLSVSSKAITCCREKQYTSFVRQILILLPLLPLYVAVVLIASRSPSGDSPGYIDNAARILHVIEGKPGPYTHILKEAEAAGPVDPTQDLRLWWGPGYPLLLIPFVAFRLPWLVVELLNGLCHFVAILYFYALVHRYISRTAALVTAVCLGLYPPLIRNVSAVGPEDFSVLLVCGFMFHFCALYNSSRRHLLHLLAASLYLTYLALTKVFFGYVIVAVLAFFLVLLFFRRTFTIRIAIAVFLVALSCCVPYLLYTYHLTGKLFYWGTSGGMSLYWMSTPYPNESGSWFSFRDVNELPELAQHRPFFAKLKNLSDVERDDAFKKQAVFNIIHHPFKYMLNWLANMGRLLISYPYSFTPQKLSTYFFMPNMFVAVLFVLSITPALLRRAAIPFELWALLLFALTAIGGCSLLSAYERQFRPMIPVLCTWLAFICVRVLRIELRSDREISSFS